jgi:sugar/nucleoside kinase (ribokinase family)
MTPTAPDYLLIGHITADLTPSGRMAGGTVSYAARTAAAFGLRVALLTSARPDEPVLDAVRPYAEIVSIAAAETTTFENIYTPEGRRQYVRGAASQIMPGDIPAAWRAAPLVHIAPIAGEGDTGLADAFPNATVLLTLQGWLRQWDETGFVRFRRWFRPEALAAFDMVVFSEEDIVESPALESEFRGAVDHVFVTRAERGGTHYHRGEPHAYSTPQVEFVHPTGAGDVFAASLLAAHHLLGGDMNAAIAAAAHLAALSVTRFGLESAPTAAEAAAALALAQAAR